MIEGAGTPERSWRAWSFLDRLPELPLDATDVLVVAPHPDDEVLGAGGALVGLHARGSAITVLALTDGEASHPGAPIDPRTLARLRIDESDDALRRLLGGCPVDRLGLPDGGLADHESAICDAIEARLGPQTWCLAPLDRDGHPDHEAATRAAAVACARRGARLVEYPVWMWHWSAPGDPRVPWPRARSVRLSAYARTRKSSALAAFASQIAPICDGPGGEAILPAPVLERFLRPSEVLFV